tara:strand:+ start:517 stop:1155 length:639 start_codon:yes stop_codon:yes gene_type:complete
MSFGFDNVESEKSFMPIAPGANVAVKLVKVEIDKDGNLDMFFKGTDVSNPGDFKPRFWVSNLTPGTKNYKEDDDKNAQRQLKHILEGFLSAEEVGKVRGADVKGWFVAIKEALKPEVTADVAATMKIVYKWDSDELCVIPKYGSFLSTPLMPRKLQLRDKVDKKGLPFDRVEPMAVYGVVPDEGAPEAATADAFAAPEGDAFAEAGEEAAPF